MLSGYDKLSPVMWAAAYGHEDVLEFLLGKGANINLRDKFARSALTYAVRNGHARIAASLIDKGVVLHAPDSSGNSPLHYACAYGFKECA